MLILSRQEEESLFFKNYREYVDESVKHIQMLSISWYDLFKVEKPLEMFIWCREEPLKEGGIAFTLYKVPSPINTKLAQEIYNNPIVRGLDKQLPSRIRLAACFEIAARTTQLLHSCYSIKTDLARVIYDYHGIELSIEFDELF